MDAIEDEIVGRNGKGGTGGTAQPQGDGTKPAAGVPKGLPKPTKPGDAAHAGGKYTAYSEDGKTWGPVPDWLAKKKPGQK